MNTNYKLPAGAMRHACYLFCLGILVCSSTPLNAANVTTISEKDLSYSPSKGILKNDTKKKKKKKKKNNKNKNQVNGQFDKSTQTQNNTKNVRTSEFKKWVDKKANYEFYNELIDKAVEMENKYIEVSKAFRELYKNKLNDLKVRVKQKEDADRFNGLLKSNEVKIKNLQDSINNLKNKYEDLEKTSQEQANHKDKILVEKNNKIEELNNDLRDKNKIINVLKNQINEKIKRIDKVTLQFNSKNVQLDNSQKELNRVKKEYKLAKNKLNKIITEKERQINEFKNQIDEKIKEAEEVTNKLNGQTKILNDTQQQLNDLKKEHEQTKDNLNEIISQKEKQIDEFKNQISIKNKEAEEVIKVLNDKALALKNIQKELDELKQRHVLLEKNLNDKINEKNDEINILKDNFEKKAAEAEELTEKLNKQTMTLESTQQELNNLKRKNKLMEANFNKVMHEKNNQINELKNKNVEETAWLTEQLNNQTVTRENAERALNSLQQEHFLVQNSLNKTINEQDKQIKLFKNDINKKNEEAQRVIRKLKNENKILNEKQEKYTNLAGQLSEEKKKNDNYLSQIKHWERLYKEEKIKQESQIKLLNASINDLNRKLATKELAGQRKLKEKYLKRKKELQRQESQILNYLNNIKEIQKQIQQRKEQIQENDRSYSHGVTADFSSATEGEKELDALNDRTAREPSSENKIDKPVSMEVSVGSDDTNIGYFIKNQGKNLNGLPLLVSALGFLKLRKDKRSLVSKKSS